VEVDSIIDMHSLHREVESHPRIGLETMFCSFIHWSLEMLLARAVTHELWAGSRLKMFGMTPTWGSKIGAACGVRAWRIEISRGSDLEGTMIAADVILDPSHPSLYSECTDLAMHWAWMPYTRSLKKTFLTIKSIQKLCPVVNARNSENSEEFHGNEDATQRRHTTRA
jgi:hypothetical protein